MEEIKFSAKFAHEMKFFKNRGKFVLKLSIGSEINSVRGVKNLIMDFKIKPSLSLVNHTPSQTNGIEIR